MLSPKQKRNLKKILPFGIIWGGFGLLYVIIEYGIMGDAKFFPSTNNPYDLESSLVFAPITCFMMGILLGTAEVLLLNTYFIKRTLWQKILLKTALYLISNLILLLSIGFLMNSMRMDLPPHDPQVIQSIILFIDNFVFFSIALYIGVVTVLTLFIAEVSDYLGGSVFSNFFTGKYHHPREEKRIFMFLDMKSSTSIAEKLGHLRYFQLLNKYYADTTDAIVDTSGEVYQYAGDEIIISWTLKNGIDQNNCIRCFFMIKESLHKEAKKYIANFGLVPDFKAGLHYGIVTTGEIGVLKKEIFFTGDVLNTTARIQSICNELKSDLLISGELKDKMNLSMKYMLEEHIDYELKGRKEKINLFSISKALNS